jgi:hypothetical protein
MRREKSNVLLTVLLFLGCLAANGQALPPAWSGRITDPSGGLIDGAVVRLERLDRTSEAIVVSSERGTYTIPALADGRYSLEATAPGFMTVKYVALAVDFPHVVRFDVQLRVGPIFEGGITQGDEAHFYGILQRRGVAISRARVCLTQGERVRCSETNALGQYYLHVLPGLYTASVRVNGTEVFSSQVNLSTPSGHRDLIVLGDR